MKRCLIALLIAILAAGCASASAPSFLPPENQEKWVQNLLIGTWAGYMKDTRWARIGYNDRILQIFEIRKESSAPNGWEVNAILNRESLQHIELNVYNNTVTLTMLDNYNALYILEPYENTHLMGKASYDRGAWMSKGASHDVVLKKVSR